MKDALPRHDPFAFQTQLARRLVAVVSLAGASVACASSAGGGATGLDASSASSATSSGSSSSRHASGSGAGGAPKIDGGSVNGGSGGAGGTSARQPIEACFPWPPVPADAGADADVDAAPFDGGPAPAGCPVDPMVALDDFLALQCAVGWEPYKILSGPTGTSTTECCYEVYDLLCAPGGRPYRVKDTSVVAASTREDRGWGPSAPGEGAAADAPRESLSAEERAILAAAWTADAVMEHASIASFSRFSLSLMALGAPSDLVGLAHRAAIDEVDHTRACFALAARYAGQPVAPGRFPLNGSVEVDADLVALAVSTVIEGCVGETIAAVTASERLGRASDPAVCATLARIAEDEARHAELAWKTLAWAIARGGDPVRAGVAEAFSRGMAEPPPVGTPGDAPSPRLEAHGVVDRSVLALAVRRAMTGVIGPASRAALAPGGGAASG